jgi:predicted ATPase
MGREFSFDLLAQVHRTQTGREWEALLASLQEAMRARILTDVAAEGGRFRFSHVLIRETLYEDLPLPERVQLHRRVGEALETLYGAELQPYLTELADHFFKAEQPGDVDKAIRYAVQAGERAAALLAYEEAANYYTRALQLLGRTEENEP